MTDFVHQKQQPQQQLQNPLTGSSSMPKNSIIRRQSLSAPSSPVSSSTPSRQQRLENATASCLYHRAHYHSPQQQRRRCEQRKIIYESPRLEQPDDLLFPSSSVRLLRHHEARWRYMSEIAGSHRQDAAVLRISRRDVTPAALRFGMPAAAAEFVRELHLRVADTGDDDSTIPQWLDVIVTTFPNVKHLYLQDVHDNKTDDGTEEEMEEEIANDDKYVPLAANAESSGDRENGDKIFLRRMYVIYRLPWLESLDGIPVTAQERRLARPCRQPSSSLSAEWIEQAQAKVTANKRAGSLLDQEEDDDDEEEEENRHDNNRARSTRQNQRILRASAVTDVEVDLSGLPMTLSRLRSDSCNGDRSPPDMDRLEFVSVESSSAAACEWTCGTIPLPLFRNNTKPPVVDVRQRTKSKFHLNFRRQPKKSSPKEDLTRYTYDDEPEQPPPPLRGQSRRIAKPVIPSDHHENIATAADAQVKQSSETTSSSPVATDDSSGSPKALPQLGAKSSVIDNISSVNNSSPMSSNSSADDKKRRLPPSASLTCPFPMQFRVRARDVVMSPKTLSPKGNKEDLTVSTSFNDGVFGDAPSPPPPPPPRPAMETIGIPIKFTRTYSSPSRLLSPNVRNNNKANTTMNSAPHKGELPPPCPKLTSSIGRRSFIAPRRRRSCMRSRSTSSGKRRTWKEQQSARSTSIMDDYDDDDSDISSDEENIEMCQEQL